MKQELLYLHDLMVRIDTKLDSVAETQIKQQAILDEHIKRSAANEAAIELLKKRMHMFEGVAAFLSLLSIIATIVVAVKG